MKGLWSLLRACPLQTVCEETMCQNFGECWNRGTAAFLLLGDICNRGCGFCDIKHGRPTPIDPGEPGRVARAAKAMNLRYVVITSVNLDDQPNGGASAFAWTIRALREALPGCTIEVLIPDFKGSRSALRTVLLVGPDILNHNVEMVERLLRPVQPQDHYARARAVLQEAKQLRPDQITKSSGDRMRTASNNGSIAYSH